MFKNFMLLLFVVFGLYGKESVLPKKTRKYNLSICALFTNQAKYLKEWIEFHRLVGVDHFYLYTLGSTDQYATTLAPFIKKGIVSLVRWAGPKETQAENSSLWALGTQIPAYEHAIHVEAANETKWLAFVDINEFLIPAYATKLTDILEQNKDAAGIILTEDHFDACPINQLPNRRLLIETVDRVKAPEKNLRKSIEKTIFKPEFCKMFVWPPYKCIFTEGKEAVRLDRKDIRINHYLNREKSPLNSEKRLPRVQMHHPMCPEDLTHMLDAGYIVEDPERVVERFVPDLLKRLY